MTGSGAAAANRDNSLSVDCSQRSRRFRRLWIGRSLGRVGADFPDR